MSSDLRRAASARHYVIDEPLAARLQPTVLLAARALGFPVAMINILDDEKQHTVGSLGRQHVESIPREESLCEVVVRSGETVVAPDIRTDPRFAGLPAVVNGEVGSYVGVPLIGRESLVVGAICVVDAEPRSVDPERVARLVEFGKVVEDQLDLMRRLSELRRHSQLSTDVLAAAIRAGEIIPWYQPILDVRTGELSGFEALARWVHPSGLVEDPNGFVPLAEDSDLIIELDLMMMRKALSDLARWHQVIPTLKISLNLSGRHFDQPDWINPIDRAVAEAGVPPSSVVLELTETSRLSPRHTDGAFVRRLQDKGFQVWLDDFGTGWSSMEYLLQLPADGVKVDRVMALAMGTHVGDALIRSITTLAHELDMLVTIEGVESEDQAAAAAELGGDFAQGYLWGPPMPAENVDPTMVGGLPSELTGRADGKRSAAGPRLPTERDLAAAVLNTIPDATAVLDESGTIVSVNRSWLTSATDNGGSNSTSGVGVNYLDVCDRSAALGVDDARQVALDIRSVLAGRAMETETEYPCPSPTAGRWFMLRITRLDGPMVGAVVSHVDITRRKMAEQELAHSASHDPLSGLANRTLFHARLWKALRLREGRRNDRSVGVVYIDLDEFKAVNDTFGHAAGDDVLRTVASRIRGLARHGDTIGRLGGDEFAILVPKADRAALEILAEQLEKSLAEPHLVRGVEVVMTGSVGFHLAVPGEDIDHALQEADRAMYSSKQKTREGKWPGAEQSALG